MLAWERECHPSKAVRMFADNVDSRGDARSPSHFITMAAWPCCRSRSESYLIFMAAFWVCAYDLVSLSLWPGNLHPTAAHRAMVGNRLWLLLGHLLGVLQIG